jgi:hypothetical protein
MAMWGKVPAGAESSLEVGPAGVKRGGKQKKDTKSWERTQRSIENKGLSILER